MKFLLLPLIALALPHNAEAAELVKTCNTNVSMPGDSLVSKMNIKIYQENSQAFAIIEQEVEGEKSILRETVTIYEGKVRPNIDPMSDPGSLNLAEKLVAHGLLWATDPDLSQFLDLSFDLKNVRSGKAYQIGASTNMGISAVMEAYDEKGAPLGSFLGGFLISECR